MLPKVKNINGEKESPLAATIFGMGEDNIESSAVKADRLKILKLMIAKGANVNQTSYGGQTPLALARRMKNNDMIAELIKAGAK